MFPEPSDELGAVGGDGATQLDIELPDARFVGLDDGSEWVSAPEDDAGLSPLSAPCTDPRCVVIVSAKNFTNSIPRTIGRTGCSGRRWGQTGIGRAGCCWHAGVRHAT